MLIKKPAWVIEHVSDDHLFSYVCPACEHDHIIDDPGSEVFTCESCGRFLMVPFIAVVSRDQTLCTTICGLLEPFSVVPDCITAPNCLQPGKVYNLVIVDLDYWNQEALAQIFDLLQTAIEFRLVFVGTEPGEDHRKEQAMQELMRRISETTGNPVIYKAGEYFNILLIQALKGTSP